MPMWPLWSIELLQSHALLLMMSDCTAGDRAERAVAREDTLVLRRKAPSRFVSAQRGAHQCVEMQPLYRACRLLWV